MKTIFKSFIFQGVVENGRKEKTREKLTQQKDICEI